MESSKSNFIIVEQAISINFCRKCRVLSKTGKVRFNVTAVLFLCPFFFIFLYLLFLSFFHSVFISSRYKFHSENLNEKNHRRKAWKHGRTIENGDKNSELECTQIGPFWVRITCNGQLVCKRQYSKIVGFHERMKLSCLSE
jgi:hypothetical protein